MTWLSLPKLAWKLWWHVGVECLNAHGLFIAGRWKLKSQFCTVAIVRFARVVFVSRNHNVLHGKHGKARSKIQSVMPRLKNSHRQIHFLIIAKILISVQIGFQGIVGHLIDQSNNLAFFQRHFTTIHHSTEHLHIARKCALNPFSKSLGFHQPKFNPGSGEKCKTCRWRLELWFLAIHCYL